MKLPDRLGSQYVHRGGGGPEIALILGALFLVLIVRALA